MGEYRQTFFQPDRVIHHVTGRQVMIRRIADGRRDRQFPPARRWSGA